MKKIFKPVIMVLLILTCLLSFSACGTDTDGDDETQGNGTQEIYSISDIEKALAFDNYETVIFATSFARLTVNTSTGIIGLFDMQGNMTQISLSTFSSDNYDVIQIEHQDFWNAQIRRVKITYYKYSKIILNKYEAIDFLEAKAYMICDASIVRVYEK